MSMSSRKAAATVSAGQTMGFHPARICRVEPVDKNGFMCCANCFALVGCQFDSGCGTWLTNQWTSNGCRLVAASNWSTHRDSSRTFAYCFAVGFVDVSLNALPCKLFASQTIVHTKTSLHRGFESLAPMTVIIKLYLSTLRITASLNCRWLWSYSSVTTQPDIAVFYFL